MLWTSMFADYGFGTGHMLYTFAMQQNRFARQVARLFVVVKSTDTSKPVVGNSFCHLVKRRPIEHRRRTGLRIDLVDSLVPFVIRI
ncbi:hypothetical protein C1S81_20255 [Mycolicibacterium neoaurum]|nr:hypothetical protein C1S81_20255 [Mycolicibacterium neoaurum]